MSSRKWRFRLQDMLDAIEKIEKYVRGLTFEDFMQDEKTSDAVIRQLTVLGEAASHVPDEIVTRTPEIPWYEIRGMRNIAVHEYFGINLENLWQTATKNIAELRPLVERLLSNSLYDNDNNGL